MRVHQQRSRPPNRVIEQTNRRIMSASLRFPRTWQYCSKLRSYTTTMKSSRKPRKTTPRSPLGGASSNLVDQLANPPWGSWTSTEQVQNGQCFEAQATRRRPRQDAGPSMAMSRCLLRPAALMSDGHGHGFPFRHGLQAVNMCSENGAF